MGAIPSLQQTRVRSRTSLNHMHKQHHTPPIEDNTSLQLQDRCKYIGDDDDALNLNHRNHGHIHREHVQNDSLVFQIDDCPIRDQILNCGCISCFSCRMNRSPPFPAASSVRSRVSLNLTQHKHRHFNTTASVIFTMMFINTCI